MELKNKKKIKKGKSTVNKEYKDKEKTDQVIIDKIIMQI